MTPVRKTVLTDRQTEVLFIIVDFYVRRVQTPSMRELCEMVGINSTNGINDHLKALERKGYVTRVWMQSRGILPTPAALAVFGRSVCSECGGEKIVQEQETAGGAHE